MKKQTSPPRLETQALSCAYAVNGRKTILHNINLALYPGELIGLIGPNGAGKTTLLRALARLLQPQEGQVLLDGQDIWQLSPRQVAQHIGRVPQSANAAWPYTTEHVVRMGRYPHRGWLSPFNGKDAAAVDKALTLLGLQLLRGRLLNTLSGGEQQRVLIARALVQEPTVLLLDEPIANLDINHQHQVLAMVQNLVLGYNLAALLAIHDLGLAARYCHRLILLNEGRVWAAGSAAEVLETNHLRTVFGVESQLYRDPAGQWALSVQPPGQPNDRKPR
ncbi:MAG: ABC transporter ATP-binding protein [Anaerolineae bacterium]|nr:ABC transporter ATP-binding protein [Anaerolineae bacterium]